MIDSSETTLGLKQQTEKWPKIFVLLFILINCSNKSAVGKIYEDYSQLVKLEIKREEMSEVGKLALCIYIPIKPHFFIAIIAATFSDDSLKREKKMISGTTETITVANGQYIIIRSCIKCIYYLLDMTNELAFTGVKFASTKDKSTYAGMSEWEYY